MSDFQSKANEVVTYGALGFGASIVVCFIIVWYPALMLTLSAVDHMCDWKNVTTFREQGYSRQMPEGYYGEYLGLSDAEARAKYAKSLDDPIVLIDEDKFNSACWAGVIIGIIIWGFLVFLVKNIKETWPIVVGLYVFSFYPFMKWIGWAIDSDAGRFPGVDWIPWW